MKLILSYEYNKNMIFKHQYVLYLTNCANIYLKISNTIQFLMNFKELVEGIVENKPNLFVNLFCPKNKKEEVLRMYQRGEEKSFYEEWSVLRRNL